MPSLDLSEAVREARRILSPYPGRKATLHERIEAAWHVLTAALPDQEAEPIEETRAAIRRLRQANLAGVLAASQHRDAGHCEAEWQRLAPYADIPQAERDDEEAARFIQAAKGSDPPDQEAERCPACGSDDPAIDHHYTMGFTSLPPIRQVRDRKVTKLCPDPFHGLADEGGGRTWTVTDYTKRSIGGWEAVLVGPAPPPKKLVEPAPPDEELGRWTLVAEETENGYRTAVLGDPLAEGQRVEVVEVVHEHPTQPTSGAQQEGEERGEQVCGWCDGEGAIRDDDGGLGKDCPRCKGGTKLPNEQPQPDFGDRSESDAQQEEIERLRAELKSAEDFQEHVLIKPRVKQSRRAMAAAEDRAEEAEAERDRYKAGLERAADDLGEAANQFASLAAASKPPEHNGDIFARKEAEARAALEGARSGEGA